jgi:hypothetical protein
MNLLWALVIAAAAGIVAGGVYIVDKGVTYYYSHQVLDGQYEFVGYLNTGQYPDGQGSCPSGSPQSVGSGGQCTAIMGPDQTNNLTAAQCNTLRRWCVANANGNGEACDCSSHSDPHTFTYMGILRGYGYQIIPPLNAKSGFLTYGQCLALGANTFGGFVCS